MTRIFLCGRWAISESDYGLWFGTNLVQNEHNLKMFLQSFAILKNLNRTGGLKLYRAFSEVPATPETTQKPGGFAEAYEKHSQSVESEEPKRTPLPFTTLLKSSKFVDVCQDPTGVRHCLDHFYSCFHPIAARRLGKQSGFRTDISYRRRRPVHWLWLEVPLCLPQAGKERKVRTNGCPLKHKASY